MQQYDNIVEANVSAPILHKLALDTEKADQWRELRPQTWCLKFDARQWVNFIGTRYRKLDNNGHYLVGLSLFVTLHTILWISATPPVK